MVRIAVSTGGRGVNADRGSSMPRVIANRLLAPRGSFRYRLTTARCSTRSARRNAFRGSSRACSSHPEIPNGGFASTRNGCRGQRNSVASHSTTVTGVPTNLDRSWATRFGCSSTASTCAPAATSAAVSDPVPAPISTIRSPGRIPAASTIVRDQSASSRCQPQPCAADTAHHHEHRHAATVARASSRLNRFLDHRRHDQSSGVSGCRMIMALSPRNAVRASELPGSGP